MLTTVRGPHSQRAWLDLSLIFLSPSPSDKSPHNQDIPKVLMLKAHSVPGMGFKGVRG